MLEPRWYQNEAEASIFNYYASGKAGNPVIAMPTASGKSIVIGRFTSTALKLWPQQRIIIATHVKELVGQNYNKMLECWPEAPAGIHSAGLNQRDVMMPIIFGGIQSMVKQVQHFGWRDLLIVDECHLISGKDDSNYGKFIAGLKGVNPNLKVIGLSATPYRMGSGLISDGPIFSDICYDLTTLDSFNRLIGEGFLVSPIPRRTKTELNVTDVRIQAGEFLQKDLQAAVDKDSITYAACKEIIAEGKDRISWLVFCSGIEHAEHVASCLQSFGISAAAVHSKMPDDKRDSILDDFRNFKIQAVANNNVLTTGFDHPGLDLIAMLRPTASTALWVQMVGRGMRPSPDTHKENCLVLDFAGNTKRLGPINDPVIPKKRGQREGVMPVKICEACGTYNHARATECIFCGKKFEMNVKLTHQASTQDLIVESVDPVYVEYDVQRVIYNRHQKKGSAPIIKVSYFCNLQMFHEYVCLEHGGYARKKAVEWWQRHMGTIAAPPTVDEALKHVANLKVPRKLRVWINKRYPEVTATIF